MVATRQITTVAIQAMRESGTGVSCRTSMSAALPPVHAAAYVHELSADVTAVVVLDARGAVLAGPHELAGAMNAFLTAMGDDPDAAERVPGLGVVVAARTATHAVVAVAGPLALEGPTAADARAAVDALAPASGVSSPVSGSAPVSGAPAEERQRAAKAVISATQSPKSP